MTVEHKAALDHIDDDQNNQQGESHRPALHRRTCMYDRSSSILCHTSRWKEFFQRRFLAGADPPRSLSGDFIFFKMGKRNVGEVFAQVRSGISALSNPACKFFKPVHNMLMSNRNCFNLPARALSHAA